MAAQTRQQREMYNRSASLRKVAHQLLSREECETFKAALRAFRETTTAGQLIASLEKIIDSPKKLSLLREIALLLPMDQRGDFVRLSRQRFKGAELLLQEEQLAHEAAHRLLLLRKKSSSTCQLPQQLAGAPPTIPTPQRHRTVGASLGAGSGSGGSATFSGKRLNIHQLSSLTDSAISKLERAVGLAEKITLADSGPIRRLKDDSAPRVIKLSSATFQVRYRSQISPITGASDGGSVRVVAKSDSRSIGLPGNDASAVVAGAAAAPKYQSLGFARPVPPQISVIKEESPTDEAASGSRSSPATKSPAKAAAAMDPDDELMERIKSQVAKPRTPLATLQDKGFWALHSPRRNLQEQRRQEERRLLQETAQELIQAHTEPAKEAPPVAAASEEVHVMPCHDETNHGICDIILDRPDSEVTTGFSTDTDTEVGPGQTTAATLAAAIREAAASVKTITDGESTPPAAEEAANNSHEVRAQEASESDSMVEEAVEAVEAPAAAETVAIEAMTASVGKAVTAVDEAATAKAAEAAAEAIAEAAIAEAAAEAAAEALSREAAEEEMEIEEATSVEQPNSRERINRRSVSMVEVASANARASERPTSGEEHERPGKSNSLQRTEQQHHQQHQRLSSSPPLVDTQVYKMLYGPASAREEDDQVSVTSSVLESDYLKARLLHSWQAPPLAETSAPPAAATSGAAVAVSKATASCQTDAAELHPAAEAHDFGLQVSLHSDVGDGVASEFRRQRSASPIRSSSSNQEVQCDLMPGRALLQDSTTSPAESINLSGREHDEVITTVLAPRESPEPPRSLSTPTEDAEAAADDAELRRPSEEEAEEAVAVAAKAAASVLTHESSDPIAIEAAGRERRHRQRGGHRSGGSSSFGTDESSVPSSVLPPPTQHQQQQQQLPQQMSSSASTAGGAELPPFGCFFQPPMTSQAQPPIPHSRSQSRPMSPLSRQQQQPQQPQMPYSSSYPGSLFFQWMTGQMMMQAAAAQMPYGSFSPGDIFSQFYGQFQQQQQQRQQSEAAGGGGGEPDVRQITLVKAAGTFGLSITMHKRDEESPAAVVVSAVATGSPAYQQGIQPGDEVLELEGENVSNMTLHQLALAIRNQSKIRLAIRSKHKGVAA